MKHMFKGMSAFRAGLAGVAVLLLVAILAVSIRAEDSVLLNQEQIEEPPPAGGQTPPEMGGSPAIWLPVVGNGHDKNSWHPLTVSTRHHHGVNPADYVDIFGETLSNYLDTYGSISYPWQTPDENYYKHKGYIWLYDEAVNGCEQFSVEGQADCITHVLVQVHSIGTPGAAYTRFHSQYAFVRICDLATGTQCGVVATGGWADYGILHAPYKDKHCALPGDPPGFGDLENVLGQTPYRANNVRFIPDKNITQFWNSLGPNPITMYLFPEEPNKILGLAWLAADAWGTLDENACTTPEAATVPCPDGSCDYNHSRFYIFSVRIRNLPEAPFTGWTNRWGHVVEGCTTAGLDCVPLIVTDGVPSDRGWLNRQVSQTNPDLYAPEQEFDVFDVTGNTMGWMTYPGMNMDMNMMNMDMAHEHN